MKQGRTASRGVTGNGERNINSMILGTALALVVLKDVGPSDGLPVPVAQASEASF